MPFVQGKCENCGGILAVDPSLKAAICPFCGAAYVVQDSINYYNTSIKVENMHADVVNITDESSSEARLKAGAAYQKIEKYDLAEKEYLFVTKMAPQNYLGWLGLIEARTHNYTKRIKSAKELKIIDDYSFSVSTLAPNGSGDALIEKWKNYLESEETRNKTEKEGLLSKISEQENKIKELEDEAQNVAGKNGQKHMRLNYLGAHYPIYNNNVTGLSMFLSVAGSLLVLLGLLVLIVYPKDDPAVVTVITISIFMILFGIGAFTAFIFVDKNIDDVRKEANQLREEISKSKSEIDRINNEIKDIQSAILSMQKQVSELS